MPRGFGPLAEVAFGLGADYFRLRHAVIRHEVRGDRRGGRLFADWEDAARWQREQEESRTPEQVPAA